MVSRDFLSMGISIVTEPSETELAFFMLVSIISQDSSKKSELKLVEYTSSSSIPINFAKAVLALITRPDWVIRPKMSFMSFVIRS